jgi:nucleoside-diphosphate-sugar epimerase
VLQALRELERLTVSADGLVLRLGQLYGPGTIYASDGSFVRQVRAGKVPIVGKGRSTFSFTHTHDAAGAVVAALDKGTVGALNVVDDAPTPVDEWLPGLARILAAPTPPAGPCGAGPAGGGRLGGGLHDPVARRRQRASQAQPGLAAPLSVLARGVRR